MPEEKYTRCPACKTIFRVTPHQLAIRAGQVRCGQCQTVFDGNAQLLPVAAPVRHSDDEYDEATMGPATMTLRMPHASPAGPAAAAPAGVEPAAATIAGMAARPATYNERFSWPEQERKRRSASVLYAVGVPLLVLLLAGQAVYHFRDTVAARWPVMRPALLGLCRLAGCAIEPVREIDSLSIEASDLQADPAHRGLLVLTATLRNRAGWALSYPYVELTLTDARDQTVARRALLPAEYAGGTVDVAGGIPANGEVPIKLFIDASATSQAGYRLYLFYP